MGITADFVEDEKSNQISNRTVSDSQQIRSFVKCPLCGQELLIASPLFKMNQVIEDHIELHRAGYPSGSFLEAVMALRIRLSLMWLVIDQIL